jgi:RHS repeat-associated protein
MRQILSILAMTWALAVSAQTATQNYVLSQTMLDDHQGNNRLVMSEDGIVEQVNDYTPFGVQMKNSFAETSDQRYKYNGKELDRMLGLDLYDYGARFYDARIARWQTIDPLCEKYYSISPYAYCANNPIRFIDPDGRELFIASGSSRSEVQTIVKTLQKLTDDRVVCVIYSTGTKKIAITSQNKDKHAAGTKLVRSLVNSKHNGYIGINDATHKFDGSKANSAKTFAADKASKKGVGSDGYVNFNPEATTVHVTNPKTGKKEAKKRPIEIGLGHELLHLLHYFDGVMAPKGEVELEPNLIGESSPLEELNTVGLGNLPSDYPTENKLREEQGLDQRNSYK